jgi:hypothetical protein
MITKKLIISSALAAGLLVGCGGGSSDSTAPATASATGYFVDSAVANVDYDCVADGSVNKKTGADGSFHCNNMVQVRFHIGELVLGEVAVVPADGYVLPQDLVGVARDSGVNDARVTAMAQLLQSLDTDGNPANGITIAQNIKELIAETRTNFNPAEVPVYLESASVNPAHIRTADQAREHLRTTLQNIPGRVHDNHNTPDGPNTPDVPNTPDGPNIPDVPNTPDGPHTPDVHYP